VVSSGWQRYQMSFQGLKKHETMFPIVAIYAYQVLKIVESQIETNRIFSLITIHDNIRKCHLQSDNLNDLSF
jgi:hypothetical protein